MSKLFPQSIIILLLISVFSSCKKGDNDPFISLRSRKSRLCGEWKVISEEGKSSSTQSGEFNYSNSSSYSYNGAIKTTTSIGQNPVIIANQITYTSFNNTITEEYTEKYIFIENGSFNYQYLNTTNLSRKEFSGTWKFLPKNENGTTKNKETILVEFTTCQIINETGESTTVFPTGFNKSKTYAIDRLKNSEMTLIYSTGYYDYDKMNKGSSSSFRTRTNLMKKK